jgi:hypothetical protein
VNSQQALDDEQAWLAAEVAERFVVVRTLGNSSRAD